MTETPVAGPATPEAGDTPSPGGDATPTPAPAATPPPAPTPQPGKQLSQADLDKAAGAARKNGQQEGVKSFLEELGFTNPDDVKTLVQDARQKADADKTEAEKLRSQYEKLETKATERKSRIDTLESKAKDTALSSEARLVALELGAKADRVEALIAQARYQGALTNVEVTETDSGFQTSREALNTALNGVLDGFPEWRANAAPRDIGEAGSGTPAATPADVKIDFTNMSTEEFQKYAERARQKGIPLSELRPT
jgi:hypothetical protein